MDFFSAVTDGEQPSAPTDSDDIATFAEALASRYGSVSADILTARLTPAAAAKEIVAPMLPSSPMANMTLTTTPSHTFIAVSPAALSSYLADPATLVLDIRPHAAYADARLPRALSLSVPSTLLKRPLFSLQRLAAMLPSPSARTRFSAYRNSARILVYDADASTIPDSSNIHGLLRKFKNDDFIGELAWVRGGFQAVWRERRDLVETAPENDDDADEDQGGRSTAVLRTRHLPKTAFSLSSTTKQPPNMSIPLPTSQPMSRPAFNPFFDTIRQNVELSHGITERIPLRLPRRVRRRIGDLPFTWLQEIAKRADQTPKKPRLPARHAHRRMSSSSSSASSDMSDSSDSDSVPSPAFIEEGTEALAMQFYRIELAEQRRLMSVMEHHSKESGRSGEQVATHASLVFPFSITAGVEKGAKNRYRHIWPFEHARVRLRCAGSNGDDISRSGPECGADDYVNASYVQPLGTNRRYIATQGPLEATFIDFWRLCWEQNVHVIVMLTKEVEGSMVKCGAYWSDVGVMGLDQTRVFGPLTLKLVSKVGLPGDVDLMHDDLAASRKLKLSTHDGVGSGEFEFPTYPTPIQPPQPQPQPHADAPKSGSRRRRHRHVTTIKRTFELTHAAYPHVGVRKIVQLQYLEWPDMNVPDDPRGVLGLIKEAERAVEETGGKGEADADADDEGEGKREMRTGIARHALRGKRRDGKMKGNRPVLLHCSAGVGRTGGFIAVDAVLDAIRREMRKRKVSEKGKEKEDAMDVDDDGRGAGGQEVVMTVPIPVSGDVETRTVDGGSESGETPMVHVPAVVVPTSPAAETSVADGGTTPMQIGRGEPVEKMMTDIDVDSEAEKPTALTRKWAEGVLDYDTGSASMPLQQLPPLPVSPPPPAPSTLSPSMSFSSPSLSFSSPSMSFSSPSMSFSSPSMSFSSPSMPSSSSANLSSAAHPSEQQQQQQPQKQLQQRFPQLQNYGTGASGLSSSESSASTFPSASDSDDSLGMGFDRLRGGKGPSSSLATSVSGASVEGLGVGGDAESLVGEELVDDEKKKTQQQQEQEPPQRFRTLSEPQVPPTSLPLGKGHVGLMTPVKSRSAEEGKMEALVRGAEPMRMSLSASPLSLPRYTAKPHPRLNPHPLSKSSPPLHSTTSFVSSEYVHAAAAAAPQQTTVDYKEPRALHADVGTPVELSGYEEPIWEVVQDMREQRMSLCQSLRQYVFVHAAVIEGVLGIVDEELERDVEMEMEKGKEVMREREEVEVEAREAMERKRDVGEAEEELRRVVQFGGGSAVGSGYFSFSAVPPVPPTLVASPGRTPIRPTLTPVQTVFTTTPMPMQQMETVGKAYPPSSQPSTASASEGSMGSLRSLSSTGKRGASPTELLKEGKTGEVLLSKRPSIKRKVQTPPTLQERPGGDTPGSVLGPVPPPSSLP